VIGEEIRINPISGKEYSIFKIILGNLLIIAWIGLGSFACWLIHPIIGWVFLFSTLFLVYFVLRKRGCKTCYYCKTCTIGFGKLPELFFFEDGTENVDVKGLKMFPYIFVLISLIPIAFLIFSIFNHYTTIKLVVLVLLFGFSIFSGLVRRELFIKKKNSF